MRRVLWAAILAAAVAQSGEARIKAVELPRGNAAVTVDGDLREWGRAAWRQDFEYRGDGAADAVKCRFALKRDRTRLLVAFRADGEFRAGDSHVRHDGDIWRKNTVLEMFFARPGSADGYTQLAVAANGDLYDSVDGDVFETPEWSAAAKTDDAGWQFEAAIPFKTLDVFPGLAPGAPEDFRMNLALSLPPIERGKARRVVQWSLSDGPGYRNRDDMGYVVHANFQKASVQAMEQFKGKYASPCALSAVPAGDSRGYVAFKAAFAALVREEEERGIARLREKIAAGGGMPALLAQAWSLDERFDETPSSRAKALERALASAGEVCTLAYSAAVNEIAHRTFAISATRPVESFVFEMTPLKSATGAIVPSDSRFHVARFSFLHPLPDFHKTLKPPKLSYPEIVERVGGRESLGACESRLYRLYADTRGVAPGDYSGTLVVRAGEEALELPVRLSVLPIALPLPEERPFAVNLFTTIPFGGESAELWAKFLSAHYMTDVSFEHPPVLENGQPATLPVRKGAASPEKRDKKDPATYSAYIAAMTSGRPVPPPGAVAIDLSRHAMDERLRACAKYRLRPLLCNRSGFIATEHFPALVSAFAGCGIPAADIIYKFGDEDPSLVYLPAAKRVREVAPGIRTMMIPSGTEYWDMKPAADGFTDFTYSTASFKMGPQGLEDLQYLRTKGIRLSRYMNRASWAGRNPPIAARAEPWDALIVDGLDGYACWTASIRPNARNKSLVGYSGYNPKYRVCDLPPERQIPALLVYMRKAGDVYHPVSCMRLENIRDGIVDALYYRMAKRKAEAADDAKALREIEAIRLSSRKTYADYGAARQKLAEIIMRMNSPRDAGGAMAPGKCASTAWKQPVQVADRRQGSRAQ